MTEGNVLYFSRLPTHDRAPGETGPMLRVERNSDLLQELRDTTYK